MTAKDGKEKGNTEDEFSMSFLSSSSSSSSSKQPVITPAPVKDYNDDSEGISSLISAARNQISLPSSRKRSTGGVDTTTRKATIAASSSTSTSTSAAVIAIKGTKPCKCDGGISCRYDNHPRGTPCNGLVSRSQVMKWVIRCHWCTTKKISAPRPGPELGTCTGLHSFTFTNKDDTNGTNYEGGGRDGVYIPIPCKCTGGPKCYHDGHTLGTSCTGLVSKGNVKWNVKKCGKCEKFQKRVGPDKRYKISKPPSAPVAGWHTPKSALTSKASPASSLLNTDTGTDTGTYTDLDSDNALLQNTFVARAPLSISFASSYVKIKRQRR